MKDRIQQDRLRLQNPYAHLQPDGKMSAADSARSDCATGNNHGLPLVNVKPVESALTRSEVSERVRAHLLDRWASLAGTIANRSERIRAAIDPVAGARSLGYTVNFVPSLSDRVHGNKGGHVAGQFDPELREIWIAEDHSGETRLFTAAHELGHAILHPECGLHRDRASRFLEGRRSQVELEADWFATELLMPPKLVICASNERFGDVSSLEADCFRALLGDPRYSAIQGRREFSIALASTGRFNGRVFPPLHAEFGVSSFAMAIRLEELNLI